MEEREVGRRGKNGTDGGRRRRIMGGREGREEEG